MEEAACGDCHDECCLHVISFIQIPGTGKSCPSTCQSILYGSKSEHGMHAISQYFAVSAF